ncbi:peptidoglycan DD-metalloendopeptidase family protein [Streptomyces sp. NPDC008125]|uniref:peptidoglycan DD-metalloendopeptidase family protein n=1 Tax=Streptomyces sp. NPDC008125 TaxID=3364811 RepID=UPI0036EECE9F
MNDQHTHAGYAGYDASQTGGYPAGPLYGTYPGEQGVAPGSGYDSDFTAVPTPAQHGTYPGQDTSYAADSSWESGTHDGTHTGAHTGTYAGYADESQAAHHDLYDTTGSWHTSPTGSPDRTGQWDSSGWQQDATRTTTGEWAFTDTGAFPTTTFESALYATGTYRAATATGTYETHGGEHHGGYDGTGYAPAPSGYGTDAPHYGPTAYATGACDTGTFDSRTFGAGGYETTDYGTSAHDTPASGIPVHATTAFSTGTYDSSTYDTGTYDSGTYDATAWNTAPEGPDATPGETAYIPEQMSYPPDGQHRPDSEHLTPEHAASEHRAPEQHGSAQDDAPQDDAPDTAQEPGPESEDPAVGSPDRRPDPYTPAVRPEGRTEGRSATRTRARRRTPAKRSALLTIAVPSACVMGVAGIAAASVGGLGRGEETKENPTTMAAADTGTVKALASNTKLDTQLAGVDAAGADFRDRASRTQERIDLKERQAAEKKKREEEAARKEAARPKYLLPVAQHGLSAYFGQAGVNWMSVHTGIDFPVQYGTPVMAATDGTVRTQWNSAYGNMAIVTSEDGTETWYCHLSSTRIRSGSVKAGDVIAYSGSSGNSTGPHLHFEVRPGGGSAINPLPWLQSHGLDPQ